MRILHVSAQKPHSTGSGVYLTGMIEGFAEMGHRQALIAGLNFGEELPEKERKILDGVDWYPLYYQRGKLDFPVLGMSDVMPYESTRYRDLSEVMADDFYEALSEVFRQALENFRPDVVISHHLYLSTAILRDLVPKEVLLAGVCHETCLRQFQSHSLRRDYIKERIGRLDRIFALHQDQKERIQTLFDVSGEKVMVVGSGYDRRVFYDRHLPKDPALIDVVYTGKMSRSKGVLSLMKALEQIAASEASPLQKDQKIRLRLIGGGNNQEQEEIRTTAAACSYPVDILGRLETQEEIADIYATSHLFVLASFFEGLPLVISEAAACGLGVITTDIPGVREWIESVVGSNDRMVFVKLPQMQTIDTPLADDLPDFERRLAEVIATRIRKLNYMDKEESPAWEKLSWRGLCERIGGFICSEQWVEKAGWL